MRVLLTGASKGIGASIARELAPVVDAMVLAARSTELLEKVTAECEALNSECNVRPHTFDVTSEAAVREIMDLTLAELGGLDVLINCAGYAIPPTSVQETSLEVWEELFAVNMTSAFLMTREAIPLLRLSERPAILNIASTAGTSARPGWSGYAASKAALVNFSNTMAEELKPYGIGVHCLAPGRTATELRRVLAPDEDPSTIMQPEAVAKVVKFLLSDDADVIKGQTIFVRGE